MARQQTKSILIVEDNHTLASMIQYALITEGYNVRVAHDGDEALRMFKESMPDLIITDIMMPKVNGLIFARAVRDKSDVPIIVITALGSDENRKQGEEAGVDEYIVKPFDPRDLIKRVRHMLHLKRHSSMVAEPSTP